MVDETSCQVQKENEFNEIQGLTFMHALISKGYSQRNYD